MAWTVSGEVDYGALVENILVPRAKEPEQRICITALQWLHTFIKLAALEVRPTQLLPCALS